MFFLVKKLVSILLVSSSILSVAQTSIHGNVSDKKGNSLIGANVYLKGTYDGSTTDDLGNFYFTTQETAEQTLVVSFLSFETFTYTAETLKMTNLIITLVEDVNTLDAVVLSAGSFSAGDNSKISVLKPLDVVTTASALGDFVGALQTLPGTTTVAEDGRLFVRGGEADETKVFIDGMRVFSPYSPTTNNVPTRGRYSPFLFDGITFSTGGYSAEYGQALSSVLLLSTINEPDQKKTDIGIMTVGTTLGNTQKWANSSLSLNASYINLAPYISIFPDRNQWNSPFESGSGEVVFRKQFDKGLLKLYSAFDATNFNLIQEDINYVDGVPFNLNNRNLYFNSSYKGIINDTWSIFGGLSFTHGIDKIDLHENDIIDKENSIHTKLKFKKRFNSRFKLNIGAEFLVTDFNENISNELMVNENYGFNNQIIAGFSEADIFFSKRMALKAGIRGEYIKNANNFSITPRLSFAYKTNENSQLSLAFGNFNQNPVNDVLKFDHELKTQNVKHYILNYQLNNDGQIFRAEAYYKDYDNLIKYNTEYIEFDSEFTNDGFGQAKGLDLFWRDSKSIKNFDYWLSYSFLDTHRNYKNYTRSAQPEFTNKHNVSAVGKLWIDQWKSQLGFSYAFASGRPFTDPNTEGFLDQQTKPYNSLSLNWAYLIDQQKILYFSINNVLNFKNINGFQYTDVPDASGYFSRRSLRPAADQFFFVGFFWTISDDKTSNQLDDL